MFTFICAIALRSMSLHEQYDCGKNKLFDITVIVRMSSCMLDVRPSYDL